MQAALLVALGGACGALARYGAGVLMVRLWQEPLPLATWAVNLLGSFLIGVMAARLLRGEAGEGLQLFLVVGFLGSFTTFSTFSLDTVVLWREGLLVAAFLNAAGSVLLGLLCVVIGFRLGGG